MGYKNYSHNMKGKVYHRLQAQSRLTVFPDVPIDNKHSLYTSHKYHIIPYVRAIAILKYGIRLLRFHFHFVKVALLVSLQLQTKGFEVYKFNPADKHYMNCKYMYDIQESRLTQVKHLSVRLGGGCKPTGWVIFSERLGTRLIYLAK